LQLELLRRARVWDDLDWKYIEVGQRWKAGEVRFELELYANVKQQIIYCVG
jgi:hypothetical protein